MNDTPAMGLLEQELEELKKKNPSVGPEQTTTPTRSDYGVPVPVKSNKGSVLGIGFLFLLLVLVVAGFFLLKNFSLPKKIILPVLVPTSTPEASPNPNPVVDDTGDEIYKSAEGNFSLLFRSVFVKSDYTETVNSGIKLVYSPAKGELSEVNDNGLEIKVIYIKGIKDAQNYAGVMRSKALYQPDKRNIVSTVDSYTNKNQLTGYFYTITGFGVAEDWYFDVDGGLVRLQTYYNGTDEQIVEYAKMFREIIDSFKLL